MGPSDDRPTPNESAEDPTESTEEAPTPDPGSPGSGIVRGEEPAEPNEPG